MLMSAVVVGGAFVREASSKVFALLLGGHSEVSLVRYIILGIKSWDGIFNKHCHDDTLTLSFYLPPQNIRDLPAMSSNDFQSVIDFLKSASSKILSKTYSEGWTLGQNHVFPLVRSLLSNHPDIASLLLLLITLYVSLMVLNTASRWMYSMVMTIVRMVFLVAMVLGAIWLVKVGQGEDGAETVMNSVQWALNKGRRFAWNAAGEF